MYHIDPRTGRGHRNHQIN